MHEAEVFSRRKRVSVGRGYRRFGRHTGMSDRMRAFECFEIVAIGNSGWFASVFVEVNSSTCREYMQLRIVSFEPLLDLIGRKIRSQYCLISMNLNVWAGIEMGLKGLRHT